MAVAEFGKLNLVAMSYDRDGILNALQRTGATEVKLHVQTEYAVPLAADCEELRAYLASLEYASELISSEAENYVKEHKLKTEVCADGFGVDYDEFTAAAAFKETADEIVLKADGLFGERKTMSAERARLLRTVCAAEIYGAVKMPFSAFSGTEHTVIALGTVSEKVKDEFFAAAEADGLSEVRLLNRDGENALCAVAYHKDSGLPAYLQQYGFTACPFGGDVTGEENLANLKEKISRLDDELADVTEEFYKLSEFLRPLKIYCDYVGFELEKAELSDKMRATQTTVLIEAFVPKEAQDAVRAAIDGVTKAAYYGFSEVEEDEMPPTLYKNNAVVRNFESITNMYSPVNAREFDPSTVMAFFYSVFLGFIMADVGYGLMMLLGGGAVYLKNRASDGGLKRLSGVFAAGGIFAIVWGLLFNSFFGISLDTMPTVMPDAQKAMWSFMGISIPSVLVISLEIGVVHLMTGYILKAVQCWRRGLVLDGILDGVIWALFSLGVGLALAGLVDEAGAPVLTYAGGIIAGICLLTAVLTAGRKEKLLGKFTKGFGAAYGVINYASDILSYARLYGLMLSGAVIAQIISQYAVTGTENTVGFIVSGEPLLVVLGVVLMIVGHVFNLAMSLLGAYIHDARLQYVEFYGRFFEGEGELFRPLGSTHKHIEIVNN